MSRRRGVRARTKARHRRERRDALKGAHKRGGLLVRGRPVRG